MIKLRFFLPPDRASRLVDGVRKLLDQDGGTARFLSSVTGQIMSTSIATGKLAYMHTRGLYCLLEQRRSWSAWLPLSDRARTELLYWSTVDFSELSSPIFLAPSRSDLSISFDAGAFLWGATIKSLKIQVQGDFSGLSTLLHRSPPFSSTLRELWGAFSCLQPEKLLHFLHDREIVLFTDNANVARIITKGGSMTPDLHQVALLFFNHCIRHNIRVRCSWIRRSENVEADAITHDPDFAMWHLSSPAFSAIIKDFGFISCDLFASASNTKHPIFASRYFEPSATWTDAFTVSWSPSLNPLIGLRPYLCPPFPLIGRCIRKLQEDLASAILVLPIWQRQVWWPLIAPDGAHW